MNMLESQCTNNKCHGSYLAKLYISIYIYILINAQCIYLTYANLACTLVYKLLIEPLVRTC